MELTKVEMTLRQAQIILTEQIKDKVFTCVFVKKDGTIRSMNCRKGVSKYVTGKGLKFNPNDYDIMPVFDMQKQKYRMINLATVKEIHYRSINYIVK